MLTHSLLMTSILYHDKAPLSYLLISDKDIEFEKLTDSDMQNVMTVC